MGRWQSGQDFWHSECRTCMPGRQVMQGLSFRIIASEDRSLLLSHVSQDYILHFPPSTNEKRKRSHRRYVISTEDDIHCRMSAELFVWHHGCRNTQGKSSTHSFTESRVQPESGFSECQHRGWRPRATSNQKNTHAT